MFRIGDFSRLARVSARQLRFYEEIGLFAPAHADPHTGYRYYRASQIAELNRIIVLKDLGFSLEQIRDVVGAGVGPGELRNMLLAKRNEVASRLEEEAQRLRHLETRIAQMESQGALSAEDVIVRAEPARRLLSLRRTVPSFAAARGLIAELKQQSRSKGIPPGLLPAGAPQLVAVAHSPAFEAEELDVEFGFVVEDGASVQHPVLSVRELEAVERMAVCVRIGLPEDAHLVTGKIGQFLDAGGYELAGPSREFFLRPPDPARMHESIVEMQFPVRLRAA
jgi:DNA-binding transcriptional MerR regulator